MIIQIDEQCFNPDQITTLDQRGNDTLILFGSGEVRYFKNWKIYDLATQINSAIMQFHEDCK